MSNAEETQVVASFKPGDEFKVTVAGEHSLDDLRAQIQQEHGLYPHFKMRLGPTAFIGGDETTSIDCPFEVVDDDFLQGTFSGLLPAVGCYMYIGYFKEVA